MVDENSSRKAKEEPHLGMLLAKWVQPSNQRKAQPWKSVIRKSQTKRNKRKAMQIKNLFLTAMMKQRIHKYCN